MNPQLLTSNDIDKLKKIMNKYTIAILQILIVEGKKGLYNYEILKEISKIYKESASKARISEALKILRELNLVEDTNQKPLCVRINMDGWGMIDGFLKFGHAVANFGETLKEKAKKEEKERYEQRKTR